VDKPSKAITEAKNLGVPDSHANGIKGLGSYVEKAISQDNNHKLGTYTEQPISQNQNLGTYSEKPFEKASEQNNNNLGTYTEQPITQRSSGDKISSEFLGSYTDKPITTEVTVSSPERTLYIDKSTSEQANIKTLALGSYSDKPLVIETECSPRAIDKSTKLKKKAHSIGSEDPSNPAIAQLKKHEKKKID